MTSIFLLSLLLSLLLSPTQAQYPPLLLTLVNNCPFTIYPAITSNANHTPLHPSGFPLQTLTHKSIQAPTQHWTGRVWARTGCSYSPHGGLTCATGDCGGKVECAGVGGAPPATLAQLSFHHGGKRDLTGYGVSLVDGFNVGMTITPHEGKGLCPVVGCRKDLVGTCPDNLKFMVKGKVMGCKSGCEAFGTDELCCRNKYNSPQTCRTSSYSMFFKHACPATFTYAHDTPSLSHDCSSPKELKIIFCH